MAPSTTHHNLAVTARRKVHAMFAGLRKWYQENLAEDRPGPVASEENNWGYPHLHSTNEKTRSWVVIAITIVIIAGGVFFLGHVVWGYLANAGQP